MKKRRCVWLLTAIFLTAPALVSATENSAADLVGLWGCERAFGPEVRGELTIVRDGPLFQARIAGFEAPVRSASGEISFSLAGDRGEFRGRLTKDAAKIVGQWIQPRTVTGGTRYATPVLLIAFERNAWRGQVLPLDDRISFYLQMQRQEDGSFGAFLRDPGKNFGIFLRLGKVELQGDVIHIASRRGEITGKYYKQPESLSISLPFYPPGLDFTRRGPLQATGFYPRTPAIESYVYHQPLVGDDGWTTASITDVGLDPKRISALVEHILRTKTDAVTAPYIQSLLIARHGKLALEEYFYGFHKDRPHDTRSASKSLTTTLLGIAIDKGARFNLDSSVYSLFPQYAGFAHADPRKQKLTVEHLLTMSSGLDCDDNNDSSPGNEDNMQEQGDQLDWYKYTLDLPMVRNPGEKGVYCSAGLNLLGGIITNTTGAWLPEFFYQNLAQPLDIHSYHVNLMPLGNGYGAGGIYLRPRDFMKLGQLFLAGGSWNGHQVVSRQWVERATRPHASINSANDYGYGWWLNDYHDGDKVYRSFIASGNGGQFVIVVPQLDLGVVFTAGNYGSSTIKLRDELVQQFIIPATGPR
jgi:CubicO group peptidase (beta-lactamase class C family)